jgi:hypothetical protein
MHDSGCEQWYFRLDKGQIAYVRFIVESYEGLAQVTSMPGRGEVEWLVPLGMVEIAQQLAHALSNEILLLPIQQPSDWPEDL